MVLHRSGCLLLSGSSGLVAALPVLSGCALRRSLAVRRAVISLHPVSSRSAGHFGSDRTVSPLPRYCWSRVHGHASAGLLVESQRWGCCSWFYRASWLARGSPPTSPVTLLLAFRNGAPSGSLLRVFRFKSSRWGHPSGSGLSQSSIGSKALAPPSWCMVRVFAMGSPCRVVVCSRSRSKRRLVGAPSLVVGVLPSRWGHPFWVEWLFSAPSIGMKASSIHLSLVASRWGLPAGRVCGFPHSIVTKLSLVSCLVFLQDEVTLTGLDLWSDLD